VGRSCSKNMGADPEKTVKTGLMLFAFDVDGTTSWGSPPGPITPDLLKSLKSQRHIIVGASGHLRPWQVREFADRGIELDACPMKNSEELRKIKEELRADRYILIGDSPIDQEIASSAGYEYMTPLQFLHFLSANPWGLNMGSGGNNLPGYINVDNRPETNPDMVYDLERKDTKLWDFGSMEGRIPSQMEPLEDGEDSISRALLSPH